jgi:hypothetical protein
MLIFKLIYLVYDGNMYYSASTIVFSGKNTSEPHLESVSKCLVADNGDMTLERSYNEMRVSPLLHQLVFFSVIIL